MTSRTVRRTLLVSFAAAALSAFVASRSASAEYEQDAYLRSNAAVIYAQRAYARARPGDADVAYSAYLSTYYGREYAYYGVVTGDQGWFYSAAYMHYAAYTYHESIHAYRPRTLGFKAQESAYFAFLFSWYAFAS
jgi:hypothetical protein